MNGKILRACAAVALAVPPVLLSALDAQPIPAGERSETKDRLSPERMDALVAGPMAFIERGDNAGGIAAFARLLAATRAEHGAESVDAADLLMAFGVSLHAFGEQSDDRDLKQQALTYLAAAIPAYRAAFGEAHPEVAVALHSYADAEILLHEDAPPASAETALEEAYRIRLGALGPTHIETLANLRRLATIRGHPSRTRGDRARVDAAADLFRELIARSSSDPALGQESATYAHLAFARMYAQNGMADEAREQLRLGVEKTGNWSDVDRCLVVNVDAVAIESILTGEDASHGPDGEFPSEWDRMLGCFALEGDADPDKGADTLLQIETIIL